MLFLNDILRHIEKSNKYKVQEFYFTEVHLCTYATQYDVLGLHNIITSSELSMLQGLLACLAIRGAMRMAAAAAVNALRHPSSCGDSGGGLGSDLKTNLQPAMETYILLFRPC
jgi:hypothetical protein